MLQSALDADPGDDAALHGLARTRLALGEVDAAIGLLRRLIPRAARPLQVIDELASWCHRHGRLEVAVAEYLSYLSGHPGSAVAHFNCAYYSAKLGKAAQALAHYEQALQLGIDRPEEVHLNLANVHSDLLRDDDAARRHLERALALNGRCLGALFNLGHLAEQQGDAGQARQYFERCLELDPQHDMALARLADTHDFRDGHDGLLERLLEAAGRRDDPDLHFAAGRAQEQRGAYAEAWRHYAQGNELDRSQFPAYVPATSERRFDRLLSLCDADWVSRLRLDQDWQPLFICGMFRSGSTLVEQVLAAHPAFTPAGEREFFPRLVASHLPGYPDGLESVTRGSLRQWADDYRAESARVFGDAPRLTDKRPDNFLYLGLIKAMFPGARIVVTERDWRDVALSVYANRLGPLAHYATDLAHIRHYIGQHDRLIGHWRSLFGEDIVTVRYEDLVADPRQQIGRLLEALGEPWDERCMDFHKVRNTVRTASVWQVRQPLYASSVGRWRRFEAQFTAALGESVT